MQVLSGRIPFDDIFDDIDVIEAIMLRNTPAMEPKVSPSGTSYSCEWLVAEKCWEFFPEDRLSMGVVHKALLSRVDDASSLEKLAEDQSQGSQAGEPEPGNGIATPFPEPSTEVEHDHEPKLLKRFRSLFCMQ